jgi:two-component system response regulator CssR
MDAVLIRAAFLCARVKMILVIAMKKVICIVEDEKDLNELVKRYLEKEGYEVRSYLTFDEASAHTNDDDVHLWILDIMLGDKSGFDLIDEIRAHSPDVPVIFMSARDKEFDRIIGLEKGSDDYITKPFSPKELVLRVNNVMRRTYKDEGARIEVDGYEIDENQRMVFEGNNQIELTTKEFELLMLFVNNKGTAFPRDEILSKVWETNYYGSDRVVDDTLRRLRKKMPNLSIRTIYGFGYRLG